MINRKKLKVGVIGPTCYEIDEVDSTLQNTMESYLSSQFENLFFSNPDFVVFPEHVDLPFFRNRENLKPEVLREKEKKLKDYTLSSGKQRFEFMSSLAKKNKTYIAYNSKFPCDDKFVNVTFIIDTNGDVIGKYFKNYPTANEMNSVVPGNESQVITTEFGTVGCAICFDLNYNELKEEYSKQKPDIMVFSSMYHGGRVQNIWAYDTRAFFLGSIAADPSPAFFGAESTIIDRLGEVVNKSSNCHNYAVEEINLDSKLYHLDFNLQKVKSIKKKYGDLVKIKMPDYLAVAMISSESDAFSIDDIAKEFDLLELDDYLNQSRTKRPTLFKPDLSSRDFF